MSGHISLHVELLCQYLGDLPCFWRVSPVIKSLVATQWKIRRRQININPFSSLLRSLYAYQRQPLTPFKRLATFHKNLTGTSAKSWVISLPMRPNRSPISVLESATFRHEIYSQKSLEKRRLSNGTTEQPLGEQSNTHQSHSTTTTISHLYWSPPSQMTMPYQRQYQYHQQQHHYILSDYFL